MSVSTRAPNSGLAGNKTDFPLGVLNDMDYFPLLEKAVFKQDGASEVPLPDGYLERILTKEYTADDFS